MTISISIAKKVLSITMKERIQMSVGLTNLFHHNYKEFACNMCVVDVRGSVATLKIHNNDTKSNKIQLELIHNFFL